MGQFFRQFHYLVIRFVALSVLITSVQPQLLLAQAVNNEDFEAPTITLNETATGTLGEDQGFRVIAVDNVAVTAVSFFYRFAASEDFQQISMQASGDIYSVSIPTAGVTTSAIQYYIQAEDSTGNRALKGYNFDPLERTLEPSKLLATRTEQPPEKKSRTLYYVLGGLAVLALGALAGGSSSGGGGGSNCDASGCQISLVVSSP